MAGPEELLLPDGSQEQPILVDEDQDVPQSGIGFEVDKLVRQIRKGDARLDPIDLDGEDDSLSEDPWRADEENYDNDNAKIEREELDNEPGDTQDGPCVHWKKAVRNPCPCGTHQKVPNVTIGRMELGESQVVELKEPIRVGRYEAEFIEIHQIWIPHKGDHIFIRGRAYARTRNLEGRIEPRKNEVCEVYELDENDHRATDPIRHLEQALVEVPIQNIKATRTLHKTNKAFPECRFDRVRYKTNEERENEAPLTCRWQMVLSYPDPRYRRQQRPIAGEVIRHYNQDDIPKDRHRVPDSERRKAHEKIRGGSFVPSGAPKAGLEAFPIRLARGQKYTVVDIFCGAGGYSKGAEMAGLKVLAACDHWLWCCETYRQNFPDAELHEKDVYKFIEDMSTDLTREPLHVDILHFSPPCQTWSPAHTCEGKKDEQNRATLYACEKIITIFKPRIFTVEQTFGLAQDRWIPNFNALVQGFTRHGYSVKWKVLHLVEYGLPQTRKRLVMIGAAPGEQLPSWPRPTHSKDPKDGKKPFVSASKACSALVEGENLHDVAAARPTNKAPWDSNKPLGRTITTSGGQSYHPSGLREFTLAEYAVLQGFPLTFCFKGKCIKKQIGNAFAPIVVKILLKCIRVHLESFDGVTRQPAPCQIITLSDDDDEDDHENTRPQLHQKDHSRSQIESQLGVDDLVGFGRKPYDLSQGLLQGMIKDFRENSVKCFLAKTNQTTSKGGSSSVPSLRRSNRGGSREAQPIQENTIDSYFLPAGDQDSATVASTNIGGNSSAVPGSTEESALTAPDDDNTAAQGVTDGTSNATFQVPSTSDEEAQTSNFIQNTCGTVDAPSVSAPPRQSSLEPDEANEETAPPIADLRSPIRQTYPTTRSSTEGQSSGQAIMDGVLNAPPRDPSDSDTNRPMARQNASTVADLNYSPRQTRSASLGSTGHRSARTAQILAGMADPSPAGRSSSSDAAASQLLGSRRIIDGILTAPTSQSPPGSTDTAPLIPVPVTTQRIPDIEEATQNPTSQTDQSRADFDNDAPYQAPRTVGQAIAGIIAAAHRSRIFPGLVEELRNLQADEDAAPRSPPSASDTNPVAADQTLSLSQNTYGIITAPTVPRRESSPAHGDATPCRAFDTAQGIAGVPGAASHNRIPTRVADTFRAAGVDEGADSPGLQGSWGTHHVTPHQGAPTPQSGPAEGAISSSTRQTGMRAAVPGTSQGIQTGGGVAGPSRRRSSCASVAYVGESSRAGARRSLPIVVEDDEDKQVESNEQGDLDDREALQDGNVGEEEDDDLQLQRGIMMSLAGAPQTQDAREEVDRQDIDRREQALAFQQDMLDKIRQNQGSKPEGTHDAVHDESSAPGTEPEPEMYGPGDYKGKKKAVARRKFDEYDEDEKTKREGKQNKRPRGSK